MNSIDFRFLQKDLKEVFDKYNVSLKHIDEMVIALVDNNDRIIDFVEFDKDNKLIVS